jgi:integrase
MLTDTACKNAKPKDKPYRLSDEKGLYLEVMPNGSKYFRLKYRYESKEKRLAFGVYPETSLKEARNKREEARKQLAQGIDPGETRKAMKAAQSADADSFEVVAREWIAKFAQKWSERHRLHIEQYLKKDVFPFLGSRPVREITAPELLSMLRRIESRGALETAKRTREYCGQVFRYAVATGRAERDPTGDLRGALASAKTKHHASITDPQAIGDLLRAIEGYKGAAVTRAAMSLAPLVFVRPGELRQAEWAEFNLDGAEWRIPAEKMKMRDPHIVPLSTQAVVILRELHPLTGRGRYVFPSARTPSGDRCMSENAVLAALRRMGYAKDEMTGHGFRSMASTLLNEQGWHRDAIERQLAHAERNAVRAAYNYAEHLPERRKMMQAWADYLDGLKQGADVVPINRKA